MNRLFLRLGATALVAVPLAMVADAEQSTPAPNPTSTPTPRPTKAPKPTRTPRPTPTPTQAPIPVSASTADNGKTIFVARTGLIELRLPLDPSSGASWNVVSSSNLRLEGQPVYEAAPTPAPTSTTPSGVTTLPSVATTTTSTSTSSTPAPSTPALPNTVPPTGFSVFEFRATREGKGDLALDLRPSGTKNASDAAQQFRAVVRVLK